MLRILTVKLFGLLTVRPSVLKLKSDTANGPLAILYGASINIKRLYLHQGATLVFQSSQQANGLVLL
jgi:hypothetical protein